MVRKRSVRIAMGAVLLSATARPVAAANQAAVLGWDPGTPRVSLESPLTVHFNQPMNPASVTHAWRLSPPVAGSFSWQGTALTFQPATPLRAHVSYTLDISSAARGMNGSVLAPFHASFQAGDALTVLHTTPGANSTAVPIGSTITISFNHPMVPLAGLEIPATNPSGWRVSIQPPLAGSGSWLGTSTWQFLPSHGLTPGTTYSVTVHRGARDQSGDTLSRRVALHFTTALPEVYSHYPHVNQDNVDPCSAITITFDQPMDHLSAQHAFSLQGAGTAGGTFSWSGNTMRFQPATLLAGGATYTVDEAATARAADGKAALLRAARWSFTVPPIPYITTTQPREGGTLAEMTGTMDSFTTLPPSPNAYYEAKVYFSGYWEGVLLNKNSLDRTLSISPRVQHISTYIGAYGYYGIYADFQPSTPYTIHLGPGMRDEFGRQIPGSLTLHFKTARRHPVVALWGMPGSSDGISASAGQTVHAPLQTINVPKIGFTLRRTTVQDILQMQGEGPPDGKIIRRWAVAVPHPVNQVQNLLAPITLTGDKPLPPGMYWLEAHAEGQLKGLGGDVPPGSAELIAVTNVTLTEKVAHNQVLVWATSNQSGKPQAGVAVHLLNPSGSTFVTSGTNREGIASLPYNPNDNATAALVSDGTHYGVTMSGWQGTNQTELRFPPMGGGQSIPTGTYLYTDRPVYRPGQRVYFRGVLWHDEDGVYSQPQQHTVRVSVMDPARSTYIYRASLPLDRFGAFHGSLLLPPSAHSGFTSVDVTVPGNGMYFGHTFLVASYRKPTFLTDVTAPQPWYVQHQTFQGDVKVHYVFGSPARGQQVQWQAYLQPEWTFLPNWSDYSFGDADTFQWANQFGPYGQPMYMYSQFGTPVASGTGTTDVHGDLHLRFSLPALQSSLGEQLTVEATGSDASDQAVSGRLQRTVYLSAFSLGLKTRSTVLPAGKPDEVSIVSVLPDGRIRANTAFTLSLARRTYTDTLVPTSFGGDEWKAIPHDTVVQSGRFATDAHGRASFSFTPKTAGTYVVKVVSKDALNNPVVSALEIDASGEGFADWGVSNSTSLRLQADRSTYNVGDTAHILVQAPFAGASALITEERGDIHHYWVTHLATNSSTVDVPIALDDLPNIYVTVTIVHGRRGKLAPDWRSGMVELHVHPAPRQLRVRVIQNGYTHQAGGTVTYTVTTTDERGRPVNAAVSLALVDTAVLALQQPSEEPIVQAFYPEQPWNVTTASSGAISVDHLTIRPGFAVHALHPSGVNGAAYSVPQAGGGGGGGYPQISLRSNFQDTAYWNATIITTNGRASVQVHLPDDLTTWRLQARGITSTFQVGEATLDTLVTRDLVLEPIAPRFYVQGDTLQTGTVLHNRLSYPVTADVSLAVRGVLAHGPRGHTVTVPAGGQVRVLWTVSVPRSSSATLLLRAVPRQRVQGDAVRLTIPVQPPLTAETVATSGQVFDSIQQAVMVPHQATPVPGILTIQVASSLTAGLGTAFPSLRYEPDESNEDTADRVLAADALHSLPAGLVGLDPKQYSRLPSVIRSGVQELINNQYQDGGWPWFSNGTLPEDPDITSQAVQALAASGLRTPQVKQALSRGQQYLQQNLSRQWSPLPQAVRVHMMLALTAASGAPDEPAEHLYNSSARLRLAPGALAELARVLAASNHWAQAHSIISALDASAAVSATGAHWEATSNADNFYWGEPAVHETAEVLAALVRLSPHDPYAPAAARWLMLVRSSPSWDNNRDTSDSIFSLAAYAHAAQEGSAAYRYHVLIRHTTRLQGNVQAGNPMGRTASVPLSAGQSSQVDIARSAADGSLGSGPLYYLEQLHYFLPATDIAPRAEGLTIARRYLDMAGHPVQSVQVGAAFKVELTLQTAQTLAYLDIEDPFPAGVEPIDGSLLTSQQGIIQPPSWTPFTSKVQDLSWYLAQTDLHDNRASLYSWYLPPGTYRYTYLVRASVPGTYDAAPVHAEETFFPEVFGRGAGQRLEVR